MFCDYFKSVDLNYICMYNIMLVDLLQQLYTAFVPLHPLQVMTLQFNGETGRLETITNKLSKISSKVDQRFLWWNSSAGNNVNSSQASGAYIFRPNGTSPFEINASSPRINGVFEVSECVE